MLILRDTIAALKRPKALALIRSDFPSLPIVLGLVPGQLAAFWLHAPASFLSFMLLAGLCAAVALRKWRSSVLALVCSFFLGLFVQEIALPSRGEPMPDSAKSYRGTIDEEPRRRRPGEVEVSLDLQGTLEGSPAKSSGRVLCRGPELPWRNMPEARKGDLIIFTALFRPIDPGLNPFSYEATLYRRGYQSTCRLRQVTRPLKRADSIDHSLRERISTLSVSVLGEGQKSGIFLSMAFGVRDVLSRETEKAFKDTGLAHLLVFSGYQVMLIYHSILTALGLALRVSERRLRKFWLGLSIVLPLSQLFCWIALPFSLALVWLCGIEGSSLRAALAVLIFAAGKLMERGGGTLNSILLSFTALILIWPGCWCEPGIQLTFAALLGICCGNAGGKKRNVFASYLWICFCISLFTSAVVVCWFGIFSPGSFILNPVAAPVVSIVACNAGYLAVLLLLAGMDPSGWLLQACGYLLEKFMLFVRSVSGVSYISLELEGVWQWGMAGGLFVIALLICAGRLRGYLAGRGLV